MRFVSGGPIIPDELLSERDAGQVVFLCGAGVSIPSGLPSFQRLTEYVIDHLSPDQSSEITRMFAPWRGAGLNIPVSARTPLDQIFNALQQVYGRDLVGSLVAKCLTVNGKPNLKSDKHQVIGRLSANQDGIPQIVTTNFDHLFEQALGENIQCIYTPPTFPDLRHGVAVSGVTYLHGRLSEPNEKTHDYVLGSADFGRAYLAEGWATAFIQQLLKSYTVVLLGYQAEDPPVKYLLQGLNGSHDNSQKRLYAFDMGISQEIESKWKDRGVTSIAYPTSQDHKALWDTLDAWAVRAENPAAWRHSLVSLAKQKPQELTPHQRGMVTHLVQSALGAKEFADSNPPLPIDWLFVFDRNRRLAEPSKSFSLYADESKTFDPIEAFGIDDDPVREDVKLKFAKARDLISWHEGDDIQEKYQRLALSFNYQHPPLTSRLFHLSRWLYQQICRPALAWWVIHQPRLHPALLESLKRAVYDTEDLSPEARKLWIILLEDLENERDPHNFEWYRVRQNIKKRGWNSCVIRSLESASRSYFKVEIPFGLSKALPPKGEWTDISWRDVATIDVEFPHLDDRLPDVPDSALAQVFSAFQQNLILAADQLKHTERYIFSTATFYPERDINDDLADDHDKFLSFFLTLFNRMADIEPQLLSAYICTWPSPEHFIFDKLRLYAWNKKQLFSGTQVATYLSLLSGEQFWNSENIRELMFLLKDRWTDFPDDQKAAIASRILEGRPPYEGEDQDSQYQKHKNTRAAMYFGWLVKMDCDISDHFKNQWLRLIEGLEEWTDNWVDELVSVNVPMADWVKKDEDPTVLAKVPLHRVISVAQEYTDSPPRDFIEYAPFIGLVKSKPVKALAALSLEAQKGQYPVRFWSALISHWPISASEIATMAFYQRLGQLPSETVFEARWEISHWLRDKFPPLAQKAKDFAYSIFDSLIAKLLSCDPEATKSGIGKVSIRGQITPPSRRTLEYAINGPLGRATEGLIAVLRNKESKAGCGLPEEFTSRVDNLLMAQGEGRDHVVCLVSAEAPLLYSLDPEWVTLSILPWFKSNNPFCEPAWNGLFYNKWSGTTAFFSQIKKDFLSLPTVLHTWIWGRENKYSHWVIQAVLFAQKDESSLSFSVARDCLRRITQEQRLQAIYFLGKVGQHNQNGWKTMVVPFIEKAWPVEQKLQTEQTSKAWVDILDDANEDFPVVLDAVRSFLRPIAEEHLSLYNFERDKEDSASLTKRFPRETLDLLDLIIPDQLEIVPYPLRKILNSLGEVDKSIISDQRFQRLREIEAAA
ncbi:SIR2 family protein [Spongorhabdus nitratireducens]